MITDYQVLGCTHFYEDTSFPFGGVEPQFSKYISGGNHRGFGRHPRIADLLGLMAELVEIRILLIYRSPLSTVRSTLRRGFSNDLEFECQLAESIHLYLAKEFRHLPRQIYRTCHYDDIIANPSGHVQPLADWWEVESELIAEGVSRIRSPSSGDGLTANQGVFLSDYFSETSLARWEDVYRTNPLVNP
jgi:hypothetical protein